MTRVRFCLQSALMLALAAAALGTPEALADSGPTRVKGEPIHSDFQYLMGRDGKLLSLIVPDATAEDIAARPRKYAANGQG